MTARRFSAPDWGQDHLSLDAVVAFVDDELSAGAHLRAEAHLDCCRECRAEVVAQRQARTALRAADGPCLPSSLLRARCRAPGHLWVTRGACGAATPGGPVRLDPQPLTSPRGTDPLWRSGGARGKAGRLERVEIGGRRFGTWHTSGSRACSWQAVGRPRARWWRPAHDWT